MNLIHRVKPVPAPRANWQKGQLTPHRHSGLGCQGRGSSILFLNIRHLIKPFGYLRQVGYTLGSIFCETRKGQCTGRHSEPMPAGSACQFCFSEAEELLQKTTVWSCPFPILSSLLTSFSLVGEHQGPTSEFRVCLRSFSAAVVEGVSDRDCKPSAALASSQGAPNRASSALGRIPARSWLATRRQQPRRFPSP